MILELHFYKKIMYLIKVSVMCENGHTMFICDGGVRKEVVGRKSV